MSDHTPPQPPRTSATIRRTRRPGWIWVIPIAALLVVIWLGIRALASGGEDITISFDNVHGLKEKDTNVTYRGMKIGHVTAIELADDGSAVVVKASIDDAATDFLKSGTRFWLKGASPSLSDLSSLGSLLSGPSIEMDPGPGQKQDHFVGLSRKPVIPVVHGTPQDYEISPSGEVGAVKPGGPVTFDGFTVGEIKSVAFRFDRATGQVSTPMVIALYPELFHVAGPRQPNGPSELAAVIRRLVQAGLRARLSRQPPLIGSPAVTLAMVPGAPDATVSVVDGLPQIPAAPEGGLDTIINKANKIPLDQISQNLLDITKHVDKLVSSPKLADSIVQLDKTLKQIDKTVAVAGPQITQLVKTLRSTALQLDETAKAAKASLGGATSQSGLSQTMKEVTSAARSLRELADYLHQHPEALIKGR
jgi:paraquat-inducible protein B